VRLVYKRLFFFVFFCCTVLSVQADYVTFHYSGSKSKGGDTTNSFNIFSRLDWEVSAFKGSRKLFHELKCKPDTLELDGADRIELKANFEVDSNLLNQTSVFRCFTEGSVLVCINGKTIIKTLKPLKTKRFVWADEKEQYYTYFIFPNKKATINIVLVNSDLSKSIGGIFEIGELKWKDKKTESEFESKESDILILFYYLAIGLVLLILFFFHKESVENLYFALFCISYSINLFDDLFYFSSFVDSVFSSFSALALTFLANYLSIVLTDKVRSKKYLLTFGVLILVLILTQCLFPYNKVSDVVKMLTAIYVVYNFIVCIKLLFKGGRKNKWEVKFIKYGFFSALFLIFGVFVIIIIAIIVTKINISSALRQGWFERCLEYSSTIGILLIPSTIAVIIGKRNGVNQKELTHQLSEIKNLSEQNLEKEKEKQTILSEQNHLLENKVKERTLALRHEKELVETKNKEILASIEYALRIQTAILPPLRIVKEYLADSFILYQPKDIVAGDFYWMETIDDLILFAACDCTGHGVSGAMVSVLCNNALNRAVREFNLLQPAAILNKTAAIVADGFSKSEEEIKDGMDISICAYNTKTKELEWAGANNPLWLIRNGTFLEIKGDKQSIGVNENTRPFTSHKLGLDSGDSIYIFSDGYADQFGGENGESKLTKRRFKELILSIQHSSMKEQEKILEKYTFDYRGKEEQTDDILVMGVKVE
jgi:serine phosphatase RsbU (regulator of sigma subunit)